MTASSVDRNKRMDALVNAARNGQQEAFSEIVEELSPLLWQVARASGLAPSDAEDVLQTVWLTLVSHVQTIQSASALKAWLVITTRREAWRTQRAQTRQQPVDADWLTDIPDPETGAEDRLISDLEGQQLRRAFLSLPLRCQELLRVVTFVHRPDYDEVASQLGMPRGSVGPTRGRCLEKLRVALQEQQGQP